MLFYAFQNVVESLPRTAEVIIPANLEWDVQKSHGCGGQMSANFWPYFLLALDYSSTSAIPVGVNDLLLLKIIVY